MRLILAMLLAMQLMAQMALATEYTVGFTVSLSYQSDPTNGSPGKNMGSVRGRAVIDPDARTATLILDNDWEMPATLLAFTHEQDTSLGYVWNDIGLILNLEVQKALAHASNNSSWRTARQKAAAARVLNRYFADRAQWGTPSMEVSMTDRMEGGSCHFGFCTKPKRIYRTKGSESTAPDRHDPEGHAWYSVILDRAVGG